VSFTADQTAQVKAMVASGDVMGAQKVMLKELTTEFGGAAKAAGETLPGEIARSKVAFGELTKAVVGGVMPLVTPAIGGIADAMNALTPHIEAAGDAFKEHLEPVVEKVTEAFHEFGDGFKFGTDAAGSSQSIFAAWGASLYGVFQAVKPALNGVMQMFHQLLPVFAPLIPQVLQLASSFSPVSLIFHAITPVLPQLVSLLGLLAATIGKELGSTLHLLLPVITQVVGVLTRDLGGIFKTLMPVIAQVADILSQLLVKAFRELNPIIVMFAQYWGQLFKMIEPLIPVIMNLVAALLPLIAPLLQLAGQILGVVISLFAQLLPPIMQVVEALVSALMPILTVLINALAAILPPVIKALMPLISSVASIFADILGPAIHGITQILGGVIDFLTGVFTGNWGKIWKGISEVFSGIWNGLTGIVKGVVNGIIDLIDGVIKGVNSIGGAVGIKIGVIPHLAEGATVMPTPGGTIVRVAEAGKPESVVDTGKLNKLLDQATNGGSNRSGGGNTFNIYEAVSAQATAMQVARRQAAFSA
jgi:phage-related protein